jgi:hypothetical protein
MSLFRREKLHERLARIGGLEGDLPTADPPDLMQRWREPGVHGVHRPREWDAVVTVDDPDLRGDTVRFVTLADGTILEEDNPTEQDLSVLADAVEEACGPPYRAHALRQDRSSWAVGARRLRVAEIPNADGDELTLTIRDGVRELVVDHGRAFNSLPALEQLGSGRTDSYVIEASRLDDDLFEFRLTPL